jgi:hypothetical protein
MEPKLKIAVFRFGSGHFRDCLGLNRAMTALAAACVAAAIAFTPPSAAAQERLKVIYSQFTMTNSATWFAREAGLFERHGLAADLVYVDSTPAVQALTAGAAPLATMSGGLAVGPYLNGLDLVMLAGWVNLNSYQLITRPEIRRVEDLRGKVIGIGRFGAADVASLSAGFSAKAQARLNSLVDRAKILVLASHDENLIQKNCNKIMRLDHGGVLGFGNVSEQAGASSPVVT